MPTIEDMKKKEHNQVMLEMSSSLSYAELMTSRDAKLLIRCGKSCRPFMEEIRMYKEPSQRASKESLMT